MKVLACSNLFPLESERSGAGVTHAVRDLLEAARNHGVDAHQVVRFRPAVTGGRLQWPRRSIAGGFEILDAPRVGTRRMFSARLTRWVLRMAGALERPDIVVCHMADGFVPAHRILRGLGVPIVFVMHAPDLEDPDLAYCLAHADRVLCRSEALERQLLRRTGVASAGVVASGIRASDFGTPQRDLSDPVLRVTMAAVFLPFKNIVPTLQALPLLGRERFSVDVYGDGPLRTEIEAAIRELDLAGKVVLHGFRPRQEVLAAMRRSHLFVQPSAPETFGLAYLEAMANGCVVLGHAGWGIDGIVRDGVDGFLAEDASPAAIAAGMRRYLRSDRAAIHARAIEAARRHTADAAGAHYARVLRSIVNRDRPATA